MRNRLHIEYQYQSYRFWSWLFIFTPYWAPKAALWFLTRADRAFDKFYDACKATGLAPAQW